ncbi:hypothetical protein AWB81_08634 [Caballeronia arationis]|nr:hypothetical protein AWB81_08634 [Caballeronia arationis]
MKPTFTVVSFDAHVKSVTASPTSERRQAVE